MKNEKNRTILQFSKYSIAHCRNDVCSICATNISTVYLLTDCELRETCALRQNDSKFKLIRAPWNGTKIIFGMYVPTEWFAQIALRAH